MSNPQRTLALAQLLVRRVSQTAPKHNEVVSPKFQALKEVQKRFGVKDNVPVYLKGGITDKLLYQATCVMTLVGLGLSLETFYKLITK